MAQSLRCGQQEHCDLLDGQEVLVIGEHGCPLIGRGGGDPDVIGGQWTVQFIPLGVFGPVVVVAGLGERIGETCGRPGLGAGLGLLAGIALEGAFIYAGNTMSNALVGIGTVAAATAVTGAVAGPLIGPRLEKAQWIKEHLDQALEVERLRAGLQPEGGALEAKGEWLTVGGVKVRRKKGR